MKGVRGQSCAMATKAEHRGPEHHGARAFGILQFCCTEANAPALIRCQVHVANSSVKDPPVVLVGTLPAGEVGAGVSKHHLF